MPQTRTTRVTLVSLCCLVSLVAAGCPDDVDGACPTCVVDDPAPPPPVDAGCAEAVAWFEQEAWPRVFSTCAGCHVTGGQADGTRFQLQPATIPDFARININVLKAVSALEVAE